MMSSRITNRRAVVGLELAYLAAAFGWRTARQWRRTGDTGIRISRRSPAADRLASLAMVAGFGIVGAATMSAKRQPPRGMQAAGLTVMAAAAAGTIKAQLDLGRSWRIGVDHSERTELVTSGLFARVRNPIFTGMAATAIGAAIATASPAALVGAGLVVAGVEAQVRAVEEPYLVRVHGDRYRDYGQRTGRFLPAIGYLSRRTNAA